MAGTKVSVLTAGAALGGTEAIPAVQSAATVKITAAQIKTFTSASPTLVTPVLGVAAGTSLALGGNGALSAPVLSGTGTWITGGTATTTKPYALIEPTGTTSTGWDTAGTGLGINAAAGFAGKLADLQIAGVTKFNVAVNGNTRLAGNGYAWVLDTNTSPNQLTFSANGVAAFGAVDGNGLKGGQKVLSAGTVVTAASDLFLTRPAAATWQHGEQDAASPVAQTIQVQSVVAGTTNTAGQDWSRYGSKGTGTGAGGSHKWYTSPAGSTGTAQNAGVLAMQLTSAGHLLVGNPAAGFSNTGINALGMNLGTASTAPPAGEQIGFYKTNIKVGAFEMGVRLKNNDTFNYEWSSTSVYSGASDTNLSRISAGVIGVGTGTHGSVAGSLQLTSITASGGVAAAGFTLGAGQDLTWTTQGLIDMTGDGVFRFRNNAATQDFTITAGASNLATFNGGITASADIRLGNTGTLFWGTTGSQIYGGTNGNLQLTNQAGSDFGRLQFGGTTSSFPALKRSTTSLQAKLADDSAFTAIQGKLTTDTAYTAGDPTTTGYLVVYDSTGTAYEIPAKLH